MLHLRASRCIQPTHPGPTRAYLLRCLHVQRGSDTADGGYQPEGMYAIQVPFADNLRPAEPAPPVAEGKVTLRIMYPAAPSPLFRYNSCS